MEISRKILEEAVELMRQQRGNRALDILRNYNITTFGQLEHWCQQYGVRTWRDEPETRAEEAGKGEEEA